MRQDHGPLEGVQGFRDRGKGALREDLAVWLDKESLCLAEFLRREPVGVGVGRVILHPDFTGPSHERLCDSPKTGS
jgi:hypothetical protein